MESGLVVQAAFDVPRGEPVRLVVPRTGTLEVEVRRQDGAPGPGVWVRVEAFVEDAKQPTFTISAQTEADGRVTLSGIPVGEIRLEATRGGGFMGVLEQADARLRLESGAHETVRLQLR